MNFQELTEEQLTMVAGGKHIAIKQGNTSKTKQSIEDGTATGGSADGGNKNGNFNLGLEAAGNHNGNGGNASAYVGNDSSTKQASVVKF